MSTLDKLARKILKLTERGMEYPEAEWEVIKGLKRKPAGNDLLEAYDKLCEDGLCYGCYREPCVCLPDDTPCDPE